MSLLDQIDGPDEIDDRAIDSALEQAFGPRPADSAYSEWLRKLRHNAPQTARAAAVATTRRQHDEIPSDITQAVGLTLL